MDNKKVLILTFREDKHSEAVEQELERRSVPYFTIFTEDLIKDYSFAFNSREGSYAISDSNRKEIIDNNWIIWNRRISDPELPFNNQDLGRIVYDETFRTWQGLLFSHTGKVVNRPYAEMWANNKATNLLYAKSRGILIPDTLITNSPCDFTSFYCDKRKEGKDLCHKLQKAAIVFQDGEDYVTYTNKVDEKATLKSDLIRTHPNMFQEYIDKEYDLRISAFEDRAIGIAIYSQESDLSKVDFRRYDFDNVPYKHVELSNEIEEFSVGILKHYGLSFGALDFVKSKD